MHLSNLDWEALLPDEEDLFCRLRHPTSRQEALNELWSRSKEIQLIEESLRNDARRELSTVYIKTEVKKADGSIETQWKPSSIGDLPDEEKVEECIQDVWKRFFVNLAEGSAQWAGYGTIGSILLTCLQSYARQQRRQAQKNKMLVSINEDWSLHQESSSPKDNYIEKETLALLSISVSTKILLKLSKERSKLAPQICIMWYFMGWEPRRMEEEWKSSINWGRARKIKENFANAFIDELVKTSSTYTENFAKCFKNFLEGDADGDLNRQHYVVCYLNTLVHPHYLYCPRSENSVEQFIYYLNNESPYSRK
jgi:hypothetical protein